MNNDRVNGKVDKVVGTVKRKAGELTGDTRLQIRGIAQQAKGSLESTRGKAKDAVSGAARKGKKSCAKRPKLAKAI